MDRKIIVAIGISGISILLLSGCITDVKEATVTGTITSIDIGGTPAFPFGVVAFDNGQVFSPLELEAYGKLSSYLNKRVTVTFVPDSENGAWYNVEHIVEG